MIWTIILTAVAAAGLVILGWFIATLVLLPIRGSGLQVVIYAKGSMEQLERQCRGYLLLWNMGMLKLPLVIYDAGLTQEARKLAGLLAKDSGQIVLTVPGELEKLIETETEEVAGK